MLLYIVVLYTVLWSLGSVLSFHGSGLRFQGLGFRVQGLGFWENVTAVAARNGDVHGDGDDEDENADADDNSGAVMARMMVVVVTTMMMMIIITTALRLCGPMFRSMLLAQGCGRSGLRETRPLTYGNYFTELTGDVLSRVLSTCVTSGSTYS